MKPPETPRQTVLEGGAARGLSRWIGIVALALALVAFVAHARIYWQWTEDDAFISFRYAQNLAQGHGLVFNPGERVEGYSNFTWVLLSAAALRHGGDPEQVAKVAGLLSGLLALALSWLLARRLTTNGGIVALVAAFHLAISPVLVQHSVSGLETAFFAVLLIAAVLLAAAEPRGWIRGALLAVCILLAMTRPEGPFVVGIVLATRALQARFRGGAWRAAAGDLLAFAILFGSYFVWRWSYFGLPFPNTFYAKTQGGTHGLIDGAQYILSFARDSGGALFLGLALVPLATGRVSRLYTIALAATVAVFIFAFASGGDWMFHYRFFAHVLPVLLALVAAGLDVVLALPRPGTFRALFLYATLALVLLATHLSLANTELGIARMVLPALARHNYLSQNYEELGRWLHDNTPPESSVAISDVGAVGYFSERRILDMFGLIDPHIAHLAGRMHYKADPKYILSKAPDYIVLVSLNDDGKGYSFQRIPDYTINNQAEFHDKYELVRTVPQYWQNEFVLVYKRR